ncbi:MAG: flagellar hook-associated protein FlgK, partial [Bacillus sp. (in: firmicutes)]
MGSTFIGLETAKRGIFTQQTALNVTGHNISNANTLGYTRQTVNFTATDAYAVPGLNTSSGASGQIGTGVEADSIQRIRDQFLDAQYRNLTPSAGYYKQLSETYAKMEEILNEPSESGLHRTMENFWNSLQTLAANPENSGAREVVAANGQMVTDTFNYYYSSLTQVHGDLGVQITEVAVPQVNDILKEINRLNKSISEIEPHGQLPNDLYNKRDLLVDQLSGLVKIKVDKSRPDPYGNALKIADGLYDIQLLNQNGNSFSPPVHLIQSVDDSGKINLAVHDMNVEVDGKNVKTITVGSVDLPGVKLAGEIGGLAESYDSVISEMIEKLDQMARAFASEFNAIHSQGLDLNNEQGEAFFEFGVNAAETIKVRDAITNNSLKIAAGFGNGDPGNNINAQNLAGLMTKDFSSYTDSASLPENMKKGNLETYYAGLIGRLGVESQSAKLNLANTKVRVESVETSKQSG